MAIETPGGLKVQTIHSFCERLLQRFPLEAGVAPGFAILDEATAHSPARGDRRGAGAAARDPASPEGAALQAAIRYAADERFDDLLRAALRQRRWLEEALRTSATPMSRPRWRGSTAARSACARTRARRPDAASWPALVGDAELSACATR